MMKAMMLLAAVLALACGSAGAQTPPRGADGRPDLTGMWSNASLTWLERPARFKSPTLPEAEARALAAADPLKRAAEADSRPSDPSAGPPPAGALGPAHSAVSWTPAQPSPGSRASTGPRGSWSRPTGACR
ncbi:hypothetical protein [Phenylobacterium sp.]|uniref:hypothetical protein n=1 Tax=Phenylobacterium sp. TaxID=1871053 RepID=UPI00398382D2